MIFVKDGQRIATENFVSGKVYNILFKNDVNTNMMCTSIGSDCVIFQGQAPLGLFTLTIQNADTVDTIEEAQAGTTNYNNLFNKPSINSVDLIGNKTSAELLIREVPTITSSDYEKVLTANNDGTYNWQSIPQGTTDYTDLTNKPQINSVELSGNKSLSDLGIQAALSSSQLDAVNSGITSADVTQIGTNENNISKNTAELVDLVDSGAKSLVDFSSISLIAVRCSYTTITDGYTITSNANAAYPYLALPFTNFKAGNYILKITVSEYTGTDATIFVKKGNYSTGTTIASQTITQTGDISIPFTLDTDSADMGITIYPNLAATATQQSITVSKLMICTQAAWNISQAYEPYCPTLAELYALVKSYHSTP